MHVMKKNQRETLLKIMKNKNYLFKNSNLKTKFIYQENKLY